MARRRYLEPRISRQAVWARRLALFAVLASAAAVVMVRTEQFEPEPALVTLVGALGLGGMAALLAIGGFAAIWRDGLGGAGRAWTGLLVGLALLAYPVWLAAEAARLPPINDITTDPADPPAFAAAADQRPPHAVAYGGPAFAALQREAYPDIETLTVEATPQAALDATLSLVNGRRWRVLAVKRIGPGSLEGTIEAEARTPIMGFRDDIAIRVRADGDKARIDLRSASRVGRHDLGANAARLRHLVRDIEAAIAAGEGTQPAQPARR